MSKLPSHEDLHNVYFYFTRIAEPQQKHQTTSPTEKEYTVTVVVSKQQYQEFIAKFPSKKTSPIENEDFVKKYLTQPPFPEQPMQYLLKFKQRAFTTSGQPIADGLRPRSMQYINGVQTDITSTNIGNGSKGTLRYSIWTPTKAANPAPTASLFAILVTDLIPYVKADPLAFNPQG